MARSKNRIVWIAAEKLRIHPTAQRDITKAKLRNMVANLDLDAIGVLHGVEYPIGGVRAIWIVDGQHRVRALEEHGFGEWAVRVEIHVDVTNDGAASDLFLKLNDRAAIPVFDKYLNALAAGVPAAAGFMKTAAANSLDVERYQRDGAINCVGVGQKIWALDEGETLSETLAISTSAWGHIAPAVEGKLLEGLALVVSAHNGELDTSALVKKLSKRDGGPTSLVGDAKGLRRMQRLSLPRCVAEVIIGTYNTGRRTGRLTSP